MKTAMVLSVALVGCWSGLIRAEEISEGKTISSTPTTIQQPGTLSQTMSSKRPAPLKMFEPTVTGVLPALADRGWVMISPLAPAKEGDGTRYLSDYPYTDAKYTGAQAVNATPYGGIKLFGWEF